MLAQDAHGIEGGEPAYEADGEEGEQDVAPTQQDGIGRDDVARGVAPAERDEAVVLLQEAEDDTQQGAAQSAETSDEPALEGEDMTYQRVGSTEVAQGSDLGLLLYY